MSRPAIPKFEVRIEGSCISPLDLFISEGLGLKTRVAAKYAITEVAAGSLSVAVSFSCALSLSQSVCLCLCGSLSFIGVTRLSALPQIQQPASYGEDQIGGFRSRI